MQTFIVSLKYAPGLAKEFLLLGDHIESHGGEVSYVLSDGYKWLIREKKRTIHFVTTSKTTREMILDTLSFPFKALGELKRLFDDSPPEFLCLYNPHPLNYLVARVARQCYPSGIRTIYLHEPYKPDKSSFGRVGSLYFSLVEFLQTLSLKETTCMIVPSPHAQELFHLRYPTYHGPVYMAPILLSDRQLSVHQQRKYFSLVGTINRSRGLDMFIDLINYAAEKGETIRFKIMTRSHIGAELERLSQGGRALLDVVNKPQISDAEISETLSESFALFLPHKQLTQSGNVPVSFRVGTPIIARDLAGFSQHITHKENGFLLPLAPTLEQLLEAILYVREHFAFMSQNARHSFESVFSNKNWSLYYSWLLDQNGRVK